MGCECFLVRCTYPWEVANTASRSNAPIIPTKGSAFGRGVNHLIELKVRLSTGCRYHTSLRAWLLMGLDYRWPTEALVNDKDRIPCLEFINNCD